VTTPEVDPVGPALGTGCGGYDIGIQKMAKGGSWHTDVSTHMRVSYHYKWKPASVHAELGFRCVATLN
jgi:formylglycine-generating enzyme required for sulfatase activity